MTIKNSKVRTPWGESHTVYIYKQGLRFVSTKTHGGYMVTHLYAEENFSEHAIKRGEPYRDMYLAYEQDFDWAVVEYELLTKQDSTGVIEYLRELTGEKIQYVSRFNKVIQCLSRWNADFLTEQNINPVPELYGLWKIDQKAKEMKKEKHPDLVIAAKNYDVDFLKVITADGSEHFVTKRSYENRQGLNLLSKLEKIHPSYVKGR